MLAQPAAFGFAGFALGRVFRLADRLADLVGLAIQFVGLGLLRLALGFECDEPGDIGLRAAIGGVALNQFDVFDYKAAIKHGGEGR